MKKKKRGFNPSTEKKTHYENMPMQYITIFHSCKNDKFQMKNCDVFLLFFFAQNIDCGGSNEYSQSMF